MDKNLSPKVQLIIECCKIQKDEKIIKSLISQITHWEDFISLAYSHGIFPLVYNALKNYSELIPMDILQIMKLKYLNIIKQNMLMTSELLKVLKILEENNILAIPFKGPVLSQIAYGDVISRQYVDLDILVEEKNIFRIFEILKNQNYNYDEDLFQKKLDNKSIFHDISIYSEQGISFEFHWRLFSDEYKTDFKDLNLNEYLKNISISSKEINTFENELLLIYLSIHGTKHNWERVEWLVDIVRLIENSNLNWEKIFFIANYTKNEKILFTTLNLCSDILDLNLEQFILKKIDKKIVNYSNAFKKYFYESFYDSENQGKNISKIQFDLLETSNSKLLFILSLFKPTELEYKLIKIPRYLNFLYYLLRPINIFVRKFKF